MIALIIVAVVLLLIVALVFFLTVRLFVKYNSENGELVLFAKVLFFKIGIFPKKESSVSHKPKKKRNKKKKRKKLIKESDLKKASEHAEAASEKKKSSVSDKVHNLSELLKMIAIKLKELVPGILSSLTLEVKRLHVAVGGDDAAQAAVGYGVFCGALQTLLAVENECKKIKFYDDIYVGVDYTSGKISADIEIALKIRVYKVLAALYRAEDAYYSYKAGLDD